jgi:hypothetical protein
MSPSWEGLATLLTLCIPDGVYTGKNQYIDLFCEKTLKISLFFIFYVHAEKAKNNRTRITFNFASYEKYVKDLCINF